MTNWPSLTTAPTSRIETTIAPGRTELTRGSGPVLQTPSRRSGDRHDAEGERHQSVRLVRRCGPSDCLDACAQSAAASSRGLNGWSPSLSPKRVDDGSRSRNSVRLFVAFKLNTPGRPHGREHGRFTSRCICALLSDVLPGQERAHASLSSGTLIDGNPRFRGARSGATAKDPCDFIVVPQFVKRERWPRSIEIIRRSTLPAIFPPEELHYGQTFRPCWTSSKAR